MFFALDPCDGRHNGLSPHSRHLRRPRIIGDNADDDANGKREGILALIKMIVTTIMIKSIVGATIIHIVIMVTTSMKIIAIKR